MDGYLPEIPKYLVRLLSRDLQVQRIGTQIDLFAPAKLTGGAYGDPFKRLCVVPQPKHAFADEMREVHNAHGAIRVPESQPVPSQRLDLNQFQHVRLSLHANAATMNRAGPARKRFGSIGGDRSIGHSTRRNRRSMASLDGIRFVRGLRPQGRPAPVATAVIVPRTERDGKCFI